MKSLKRIFLIMLCISAVFACFMLTSCSSECDHDWDEWEADGEATCQGQFEIRYCKDCDEEQTRINSEITGNAHIWGDWYNTGVTLCDGKEMKRVCTNCGAEGVASDGTGTGEHTWNEWTTSTKATCGKAGEDTRSCSSCTLVEKRSIEALTHTDTIVCTNCYKAMVNLPELNLDDYKSIGIKFKNLEIETFGSRPTNNETIEMTTLLDVVFGINENDELYGYGTGVATSIGTYTNVTSQTELIVYIEGDYMYSASIESSDSTDLRDYNTRQTIKPGELNPVTEAFDNWDETSQEIENWYNNVLTPIFNEANLDVDFDPLKAFIADCINDMFTKVINSDGTVEYVFNADAVKELNNALSEKTIFEAIDAILGEGTYEDLNELVSSDEFYAYKYSELLNYIQVDQGIDLEALFASLDEIATIMMNDEAARFEDLLNYIYGAGIPEDEDIYDAIVNEELYDYSVMDAICMLFYGRLPEDDPETPDTDECQEVKDDMREYIETFVGAFDEISVYELILESDVDADKFANDLNELIIDKHLNDLIFKVYYDAEGNYDSIDMSFSKSISNVLIDASVNIDETIDVSFKYEDIENQNIDLAFEIVPNVAASIDREKATELKAKFSVVESLFTVEKIKEYYDERYSDSSYHKVYATEDYVTVLYLYNYNCVETEAGYDYTIHFEITNIYPTISSVELDPNGCGGAFYDVRFNAKYSDYEKIVVQSTTKYTSTKDVVSNLINTDDISVECDIEASRSTYFILDRAGELSVASSTYDGGHSYQYVEEKSTDATGCTDIGESYYECTDCGDSYICFNSNGHSYNYNYTYENGKYYAYRTCSNCGDTKDYYEASITIDSALDITEYDAQGEYVGFSVAIDESTAGTYKIYSEEIDSNFVDTRLRVYKLDENGNLSYAYHANSDAINSNFNGEITLEAGITYVFAVKVYDSIGYSNNIVVHLEPIAE